MISATALIAKHAGVSTGLAVVIKYGLIAAVVSGTALWLKADYDQGIRNEAIRKCKADQLFVVTGVANIADDVNDRRDAAVDEGKAEQRSADMVTREQYNDLRRDKDNERLTFERLLKEAMAKQNADGTPNCAVIDMPVRLQRRAVRQD